MIRTLTGRKEWQFFSVLPKADPLLAIGWWIVLILRGVLPAIFAVATGMVVAAVQNTGSVEAAASPTLELVGGVRAASPDADPDGAQLQPRRSHAAWL